ncbi:MAG: S26 family signal peptidase [Acidobacteriota bacterium]|nr:S26 family signal peptidase [Acidobacteriota bacterium]
MKSIRLAVLAILGWGVLWIAVGGTTLVGTQTMRGISMEPALGSGDRIWVDLWTPHGTPPPVGQTWLFRDPEDRLVVKRVATAPGFPEDRPRAGLWSEPPGGPGVWLLGDHAEDSDDSRRYGPVPLQRLRGRVVGIYWPPERMGPIPP